MNTRAGYVVVLAILLTACATVESTFTQVGEEVTPSSAATPPASGTAAARPTPDVTPPLDCVNPPPDITTMVEQSDPLACYGNVDLTVDALVTSPGAFSCPGELQPAWFSCFSLVALYPPPGTSSKSEILFVVLSSGPDPLYAVIHPDIEALRPRVMGAAVTLTGHYDDPAAQDCHNTSWPDANPPPPEEVIQQCRSTFVITAMEPLEP